MGRLTGADAFTHLTANAVALGLQIAALLLEITLLARDHLQAREIESDAAAPQLLDDQLGILAQQALIQHGSRCKGACSLRSGDNCLSTFPLFFS